MISEFRGVIGGYHIGSILRNLGLISIGSVICAVAINGILVPKAFVSGGVTGLALVIHYLAPGISLGALYLLLNIPLFALGWKYVGRRFFLYSIVGTFLFSLAVEWISIPISIQDKFLAALLA
ncbi:MAG TPA: YitT family protein, partial [Syntrophales bacterium]|nr:YitT family protein [Syntrophales bacterium]